MKIDILGHNNFALAIILDHLREICNEFPDIRIVSNIPESENINSRILYKLKSDNIKEIFIDEWQFLPERKLIIGATAAKTKTTIYNHFNSLTDISEAEFINIIHPSAYCASSSKIGKGIIIEPNVSISSFALLEDYIWVKRNVSIGHHTKVGRFTNINPGANISGNCSIGKNCLIGAGATIIDGIQIGDNSIIGAGSVVTKDVPSNVIAYGVPAKVIKSI